MLPLNPTSKRTGKCADNASKTIQTNNLNNKDLDRLPLIPLPCQDHGTINQFQWILIGLEHQEGTGEGEGEDHNEGM